MNVIAELVMNVQAKLGEGPHWDEQSQSLLWVDITGRKIHVYDPKNDRETTFDFDRMVSAVIPAQDKGWVLAMQGGIYSFDPENGVLEQIETVEPDLPRNRLNDAKCDPQGRLWAGTMSMDDSPGAGALYMLEQGGQLRMELTGIGCSNGLAWDERKQRMYYIDTPTRRVDAFDFEPSTGQIRNRETIIRFAESAGLPDGMTIDSEGMLWIAHWGGGAVSRWNPDTGEQIGEVTVPAWHVTSCAFGGPDLSDLYITSAREGMSREQLDRYPLSGGLFKVKTDVTGIRANRFGTRAEAGSRL
ncbi:SMP-30/gluconolactonase/LRE family protein [Cohnella herbarum]|uniref:SMP-30/gluconolactonase/LRE family protein n=1 Tax=Cohnella herbarum TaxID=2728023 RepID=A0A7Z2VJS2_9BACL|nr:SMP-30/gluconolactonase/LRE family protein [Cohnella herbarum]